MEEVVGAALFLVQVATRNERSSAVHAQFMTVIVAVKVCSGPVSVLVTVTAGVAVLTVNLLPALRHWQRSNLRSVHSVTTYLRGVGVVLAVECTACCVVRAFTACCACVWDVRHNVADLDVGV